MLTGAAEGSAAAVGLTHVGSGVAVLTLDDPARRNAMTEAMGEALAARCVELGADRSVRCVVLTGTPPAFSAGGDLAMLEDLSTRSRDEGFDASAFMERFYRRFLAVRDLPVPVIAAINGHAVGAGLCLALACDLRLVAADARIGMNFARLGLYPGMGGTWYLPRLLGAQRAAAWLYTGALVEGTVAAQHGLALEALAAEDVLPAARSLAMEIASSSPVVVRQLKAGLRESAALDLDATLGLEARTQAASYRTADLVEGLAAVRARRRPDFPGH